MLAHSQATALNASKLAGSLGISGPTVTHYVDLLVDLLLVQPAVAHFANTNKRLVRR